MQNKRPQNKCSSCGHTWYPKGSNLSRKCPDCGSRETKIIPSGSWVAIAIVLIFLFAGSKNTTNENQTSTPALTPVNSVIVNNPSSENKSTQPVTDSQSSEMPVELTENNDESIHAKDKSPQESPMIDEAQKPSKESIEPQQDLPKMTDTCVIPGHC